MFNSKSLEAGVKIEQEHRRTYIWLTNYVKKYRKLPPPVELYLSIAKDHLLEDGLYYEKLKDAGL
jgi:hypothetical protein